MAIGGKNPLGLSFLVTSHLGFLDGPEIGPGALIGTNASTSGAGSGPTGTNAATATNFPGLTTAFPTGTSVPKSGDSPSSGTSKKSSHTAAIVGGAIGGAAVIAIAVVTIGLLSRRKRSTPPPGPYMNDVASQPLYDSQKPMSEVGTTAPSSTVETPVVPMKVYVRVSRTSVELAHAH